KRVIFAIPYDHDFTLIGTTERDYVGDPGKVEATAEEIEYLCESANRYFKAAISPAAVVWTYSGVRPLYDDGAREAQAATRDYVLKLDEVGAPMLSVLGGKITTYRRLAQQALDKLGRYLPAIDSTQRSWSGHKPLPGGDFPVQGFDALVKEICSEFPWLETRRCYRLARACGTKARLLFPGAFQWRSLGLSFRERDRRTEMGYRM